MATLPFANLETLGSNPDAAHSSVVINENGSWKQSSRWHFLQQIKFAMDASVVPFMIRINDTPSVLEALGTYVATTTRQTGEPVYVQISLIELAKIKDPAQFRFCTREYLRSNIRPLALDTQFSRCEACSPRVLVSLGGNEWGI